MRPPILAVVKTRPPQNSDPAAKREHRRYRALRVIGGTDDLCELCRRKVWSRAGAEDMPELSDYPPSSVLPAVASEMKMALALSRKLASGRLLSDAERKRIALAVSRIEAAQSLLHGAR